MSQEDSREFRRGDDDARTSCCLPRKSTFADVPDGRVLLGHVGWPLNRRHHGSFGSAVSRDLNRPHRDCGIFALHQGSGSSMDTAAIESRRERRATQGARSRHAEFRSQTTTAAYAPTSKHPVASIHIACPLDKRLSALHPLLAVHVHHVQTNVRYLLLCQSGDRPTVLLLACSVMSSCHAMYTRHRPPTTPEIIGSATVGPRHSSVGRA